MAYPCDLDPRLGTNDLLRAIYSKISDGSSGERIEDKLDTIIQQTGDINTNIQLNTEAVKENTQAIKDISVNIDVHSEDIKSISAAINKQTEVIKDVSMNINVDVKVDTKGIDKISDSINKLNNTVETGFDKTTKAIENIQPGPEPHPVPPVPPRPPYPPKPKPIPPVPPHPHYYPNCYNRTNLSTDYYAHYYGQNSPGFHHHLDSNGPEPVPDEALYVVNNVYNRMVYH